MGAKSTAKSKIAELCEEYGESKVIESISKLSEKDRKIMSYSLGINEIVEKDDDYICDAMKMNKNNLRNRRFYAFKRLKLILDERDLMEELKLKNFNSTYTSDVVADVLSKYSEERKNVISLYYGIGKEKSFNKDKISNMLNIDKKVIVSVVERFLKDLKKADLEYENRNKKLYLLEEKYGVEKVNIAKSLLSDKASKALDLYYGVNGRVKTIKEISKILNIEYSNASSTISTALIKLEQVLEQKNDRAVKAIESYGEETVKLFIESLDEQTKRKMNLYFGFENGVSMKSEQISMFLGEKGGEARVVICNALDKLDKYVCRAGIYKDNRLDQLFEKYGEKRVRNGISCLDSESRSILNFYYDRGYFKKSYKEINETYKLDKKQLEYKVDEILVNLEKMANGVVKAKRRNKILALIEKYGEDEVMFVLKNIKTKHRDLFFVWYGLEDKECKSIIEISEIYGIDYKKLNAFLHNGEIRIIDILQARLVEKRKEHFDTFVKIKDRTAFMKLLKDLDEEDTKVMRMYYGIDTRLLSINEICTKLNMDKNSINEKLCKEIDLINSRCLSMF